MSSNSHVVFKPLVWVGNSKRDYDKFPKEVKRKMGVALGAVQLGTTPSSAKLMKGVGNGVYELINRYDTDTYRAVYAVKLGEKVYVLHAFKKKSKRGTQTPKEEIDLIRERLRNAKEETEQ